MREREMTLESLCDLAMRVSDITRSRPWREPGRLFVEMQRHAMKDGGHEWECWVRVQMDGARVYALTGETPEIALAKIIRRACDDAEGDKDRAETHAREAAQNYSDALAACKEAGFPCASPKTP